MTSDTLTIREMCDTFEVTPRTLRFYEAKELLFPQRIGQKRLFTKRDRGFSLEEIRLLLDLYYKGDGQQSQMEQSYALASKRLEDLERQRAELDSAITDLREQLKWGEKMIASMRQPRKAG